MWEVQQYTGKQYGWEMVSVESTRREALEQATVYRANQPEYRVRVRRSEEHASDADVQREVGLEKAARWTYDTERDYGGDVSA